MKYFESPESNLIFTTAIAVENMVLKLQKKFEEQKISPENYVAKRQELAEKVQIFLNQMEYENEKISKKKTHINKRRNQNADWA